MCHQKFDIPFSDSSFGCLVRNSQYNTAEQRSQNGSCQIGPTFPPISAFMATITRLESTMIPRYKIRYNAHFLINHSCSEYQKIADGKTLPPPQSENLWWQFCSLQNRHCHKNQTHYHSPPASACLFRPPLPVQPLSLVASLPLPEFPSQFHVLQHSLFMLLSLLFQWIQKTCLSLQQVFSFSLTSSTILVKKSRLHLCQPRQEHDP